MNIFQGKGRGKSEVVKEIGEDSGGQGEKDEGKSVILLKINNNNYYFNYYNYYIYLFIFLISGSKCRCVILRRQFNKTVEIFLEDLLDHLQIKEGFFWYFSDD